MNYDEKPTPIQKQIETAVTNGVGYAPADSPAVPDLNWSRVQVYFPTAKKFGYYGHPLAYINPETYINSGGESGEVTFDTEAYKRDIAEVNESIARDIDGVNKSIARDIDGVNKSIARNILPKYSNFYGLYFNGLEKLLISNPYEPMLTSIELGGYLEKLKNKRSL